MQIILSLVGPNNILPPGLSIKDYMLPFRGETVLSFILKPLLDLKNNFQTLELIILLDVSDRYLRNWVTETTKSHFQSVTVLEINDTNSQVETFKKFVQELAIETSDNILLLTKDTILPNDFFSDLNFSKTVDIKLGAFLATDGDLTFINSLNNEVRSIRHNMVISNVAFNGAIIFKNLSILSKIIENESGEKLIIEIIAKRLKDFSIQIINTNSPNHLILNSETDYKATFDES